MSKYKSIIADLQTNEGKWVEISISYNIGGMNYFSGKVEPRGYSLHVTPYEKGDRTRTYTAWTGYKQFVKHATRFSEKALFNLTEGFKAKPDNYEHQLKLTLNKNNLTLKKDESMENKTPEMENQPPRVL